MTGKSKSTSMLSNFFIKLSTSRLHKHCPAMSFKPIDIDPYENSVEKLGDEFSMIMLWGEIGSVIFKTHFNMEVARAISANALNLDPDSISDDLVRGYMNEFNNLMGGYFRSLLDKHNVLMGMSLPFTTKGTHELFFFKIRDQRYDFTKWKLQSNEGHIIECTSEILIINEECLFRCEKILIEGLQNDMEINANNIEYI